MTTSLASMVTSVSEFTPLQILFIYLLRRYPTPLFALVECGSVHTGSSGPRKMLSSRRWWGGEQRKPTAGEWGKTG